MNNDDDATTIAWQIRQSAQDVEALRKEREMQKAQAGCAIGGLGNAALDVGPERPGIRGRVIEQLNRATRETQRLDKLLELDRLLGQHPELARILDLIEEVGG